VLKPAEAVPGHSLRLLQGGDEFFPALIAAIDKAQRTIRMETYIFDFRGQAMQVAHALALAAQRGVQVHVMMDGVGTSELPQEWALKWQAASVQWHRYAPWGFFGAFIPGRWRRLHRKLCVVDGVVAFCGGINMLDDRIDPNHGALDEPRLDYAVEVSGPLVAECEAVMQQFWTRIQVTRQLESLHWQGLGKNWRIWGWPLPLAGQGRQGDVVEEVSAGLVLRDNLRNRTRIEKSYLKAIGSARETIVLANAYFLPGGRLRRALVHAVRRGVRVQVIVQGRYEYFMQYHAGKPVMARLAAQGVEIYEYLPGFLHAKVAVIDGAWATVGSSNLDPLSLLLAREANIVVHDSSFAHRLSQALQMVIAGDCRAWDAQSHAERVWYARLFDHLAHGLMRLSLLISGRRY
jgi:cardiolipin synthase